ncbi:P-loop containing nucleoside triphosphate hydrolase [Arabidopsis suecica]|uniref:P-loop containing nucleoside triphosphate hydrolase n=1 Tax=Arabidopsis suecica TaxID=45249 RepID=A0A8T1XWD0_ARASU|nr:P-loop containing nucleoside triphosphate hydrolase [Arabidopsis suecica]
MDPNYENYHHHHNHQQQWRPAPTQPNICPICTVPHFPFCPPYPPPSSFPHNPNFPPPPPPQLNSPRPGFDSFTGPPVRPPQNHFPPWQPHHGNQWRPVAVDGDMEADRRYKRARIDAIAGGSPGYGVSGADGYQSPRISWENERRLKMVRDHGYGLTAQSPGNLDVSNVEMNHQYGRSEFRNGSQFNGVAPTPALPHHPPPYGGYFSGPNGQPPLPVYPPPPLPPSHPPSHPSSLFPVTTNSSPTIPPSSSYPQMPNASPSSAQLAPTRSKVIDVSHLLKPPHRSTRPDHFVIILRGLPGSGKSYLAKLLRDIEVENGGSAPRIHSMDDYFMTEVEKVEESELTSSSSGRSKRPNVKTVMEYCYEPEMEEAYRSSMLKAFKRTLEDGAFSFVIVDDRNLRVADFTQFWATAKRSGYEAYILESTYKDPTGCAARNIHGITLDQVQQMAEQWEEAPSLYMQLDIKSFTRWDDLKENGIQEVDMDMEDDFELPERKSDISTQSEEKGATEGSYKSESKWEAESGSRTEEVKELSRSKWSNVEEDETENSLSVRRNPKSLSKSSQRKGKSVWWGDKGGDAGFSIGAARNMNMPSLVIGPGSGYNLKSNPLSEEESRALADAIGKAKVRGIFQDQLRAECESFKAVFDKRHV